MNPLVSVIVVVHNNLQDLPACLNSIREQTYQPVEVIVVDNASTDGSTDFLSQQQDILLIRNPLNRGFAAGNNQGLARSRAEAILLLNADAWLERNCISKLMGALFRQPQIGSAAPKVLRADGITLDSTGILLQKHRLSPMDRGEGQLDRGQFDTPEQRDIFGPSGAVAIYKKETLFAAAIEGQIFDEDFFAYYEDVDLAWRLQVLGWKSVYVPEAVAWHDRKGPGPKPGWLRRQAYANRYFCYVKNDLSSFRSFLFSRTFLLECGRCLKLFARHPHMLGAWWLFLKRLPRMMRKRQWVKNHKAE